ncbi:MAG: hypothetical protein HAW63_00140 [Bdellovibrionaceae bacterium]|nr:hypothetical protein [Pseudobdellovibrionaceae bacterium]
MKSLSRLLIVLISLCSINSYAVVDMRTSNFSKTFLDMHIKGTGLDLSIKRTYNSRSVFNGIFGYGWCSDYETTLAINSDSSVLVTECGGGLESLYKSSSFKQKNILQINKKIIKEVKKRNPDLSSRYLANLRKKLKTNAFLREEFAKNLNIKGEVHAFTKYIIDGRKNEYLVKKNNLFTRYLKEGIKQEFNLKGQLVSIVSKLGNRLNIKRKKDLISEVSDTKGRRLQFFYDNILKKVTKLQGSNGATAAYAFKGNDLIRSTDENKVTVHYQSDSQHNLTKIIYPNKTFVAMSYNLSKDWVTSFTNQKGCVEKYSYGESKKNPLDHYWSQVIKKCKRKVTHQAKYEFFHKTRKNGSRYLYRSRFLVNNLYTEITYHSKFGRPTKVQKGRRIVKLKYNRIGQIILKDEISKVTSYKYNKQCNTVSNTQERFFAYLPKKTKKKSRKIAYVKKERHKINSRFKYNKACNISWAKNSAGLTAKVTYDNAGRIKEILDHTRKNILIGYENRFGKPATITRPGLGTLRLAYTKSGEIKAGKKSTTSLFVANQIIQTFNNFLKVIGPVSTQNKTL